MRYPTDNSYVSSGYGWRTLPSGARNFHAGTDFPYPVGGNLYAILDGVVLRNYNSILGGNSLEVRFDDGVTAYYQHMRSRSALQPGQRFKEGAIVGVMGNTGQLTTGPHLHFEVWRNGSSFDAEPYLAQGQSAGGGDKPLPDTKPIPVPEETKVTIYTKSDARAKSAGITLPKGKGAYLFTGSDPSTSKASNVIGGVGPYSTTGYVYAEGKPGDILIAKLIYQFDPNGKPRNSAYYEHRLVVDRDGKINVSIEDKHEVAAVNGGTAVYLRVEAAATNASDIKVTRLDSVAHLYSLA